VFGESTLGEGVRGVGHSAAHGAVVGTNDNANGVGVFGKGGRLAGQFEGNVEVTGHLTIQGNDVIARIQAVEGLVTRIQSLETRVTTSETRLNTLQTQVNNLQAQLGSLQNKEASDVQGIAVSLATLAARVTALGG
jgi:hypothetical protein